MDDESERRLSVIAHASALLGLLLPLGQLLGPYLAWLLIPPQSTRARPHAAQAFNFQLAMVAIVALLLAALLWFRGGWWYFVLFAPNLYAFGMALWGATRASRGSVFHYPFGLPVIRVAAADPGGAR